MSLWYTPSPARYFHLPPDAPAPAGGLLIRSPAGAEMSVSEDWVVAFEISAEEGGALLESAAQEGLGQLSEGLRQLWEVGRQSVISELGEDPVAALQQANAETASALTELEEEISPEVEALAAGLTASMDDLLDVIAGLGQELAQVFDTDEGRQAMAFLGEKLTALGKRGEE